MPELSEFILAALVIGTGAVLQAATGFGAGLMIVPLLALIDMAFLPGPIIFASLALSSIMTWKGRSHVEWTFIPIIFITLAGGSLLAISLLSRLPKEHLGYLFGAIILIGVVVSAAGFHIRLNRRTASIAGVVSGFMGTTSGFGAPPLALVYQNYPGLVMRATLSVLYLTTSPMILILLWHSGLFNAHDILIGLGLVPGYLLGYFIARPLAAWLDKGYSRIAILVTSILAAGLLIIRTMLAS